jgi:hypothetical protein
MENSHRSIKTKSGATPVSASMLRTSIDLGPPMQPGAASELTN